MRSSSEKILKDTGYLLGSSVVARIISGAAGIVTARVLGPADYGLLRIINYIPSLAKFGSFGFGAVAKREIPHVRGSGQGTAVEKRIKDVSFSADILWSALLSLVIFSVSFFYERPEVKIGLWIVSVSLFVRAIGKLYGICLSVDKRFSTIALISMIGSIVSSAIILSTIYWGGIYSVLGAGLTAGFFTLLYFQRKTSLNLSFSIPKDEFLRQLKIAMPLAGGTVAFGIFGWVQRLQVSALFGIEALGYYMLIIFIIQIIFLLINTFLKASSIELYERLGEGENTKESRSLIIKPSMALGLLLPLVGAMAWLAGPLVLNVILPDYKPALVMLPFLIPILVFEGVSAMPRTAMKSAKLNMQTSAMVLRLFSTLCFALITYIVGYRYDYSLEGIIMARTIASLIMFIGCYTMTVRHFFDSVMDMLKKVLEMLFPALSMILVCFFLVKFVGTESIGTASLSIIILFLLMSPIVYTYIRKLKLIILFRGLIGKAKV